jgi:hypothetical protein
VTRVFSDSMNSRFSTAVCSSGCGLANGRAIVRQIFFTFDRTIALAIFARDGIGRSPTIVCNSDVVKFGCASGCMM